MTVDVEVHPQARLYEVRYAQDPAPADLEKWEEQTEESHIIVIEELESGKKYSVRVAYRASEEKLFYSPAQSIFIQ